ncbi:hypothetical protein GEMRC1_006316 [Eukaryota sp. GEM-RC1]
MDSSSTSLLDRLEKLRQAQAQRQERLKQLISQSKLTTTSARLSISQSQTSQQSSENPLQSSFTASPLPPNNGPFTRSPFSTPAQSPSSSPQSEHFDSPIGSIADSPIIEVFQEDSNLVTSPVYQEDSEGSFTDVSSLSYLDSEQEYSNEEPLSDESFVDIDYEQNNSSRAIPSDDVSPVQHTPIDDVSAVDDMSLPDDLSPFHNTAPIDDAALTDDVTYVDDVSAPESEDIFSRSLEQEPTREAQSPQMDEPLFNDVIKGKTVIENHVLPKSKKSQTIKSY